MLRDLLKQQVKDRSRAVRKRRDHFVAESVDLFSYAKSSRECSKGAAINLTMLHRKDEAPQKMADSRRDRLTQVTSEIITHVTSILVPSYAHFIQRFDNPIRLSPDLVHEAPRSNAKGNSRASALPSLARNS